MARDSLVLHLFLNCRTCGSSSHQVAVSTENELVVYCEHCDRPVAVFRRWPDKEFHAECEHCANRAKN